MGDEHSNVQNIIWNGPFNFDRWILYCNVQNTNGVLLGWCVLDTIMKLRILIGTSLVVNFNAIFQTTVMFDAVQCTLYSIIGTGQNFVCL